MAELVDNIGVVLEVPGFQARSSRESKDNESVFSESELNGLPYTLSCMGIDWDKFNISEFETYEPLGILVELAKAGKIDPWDIDIM